MLTSLATVLRVKEHVVHLVWLNLVDDAPLLCLLSVMNDLLVLHCLAILDAATHLQRKG